MMSKPKLKVLAIDPGTREMGVALLENGTLIYHGVKLVTRGRSPHETLQRARAAVVRLLEDLKPDVVVVEKTFIGNNRSAALLSVLADEIKALAKARKLLYESFAPSSVKKTICGDGRATKEEVAKVIAKRFPELKAYLSQNRKWKDRFHQNMFDAVAVGLTALVFTS